MTLPARLRDERGSIAVEVAVIAPALLFLMLLVVYAGKVSEADGNVERAASDAARAASPSNAGPCALGTSIDGNRVALSDPLAPGPITISMAELELALTSPLAGGPFGLPVPPYNGGVLLERS